MVYGCDHVLCCSVTAAASYRRRLRVSELSAPTPTNCRTQFQFKTMLQIVPLRILYDSYMLGVPQGYPIGVTMALNALMGLLKKIVIKD